jgi:beta-glucosidase
MPKHFPPGFLWGCATSSHQVEGWNTNNQWWDWEQHNGRIWQNDRSLAACDWWRDPLPDFDRAVALGQNAHRLSIEWSRIEPDEGQFDPQAIERYRTLLQALRERNLTPMVTLHHFSNPRWLEQKGGWLHPHTPRLFARFAAHAATAFGDLCDLWCTINEPNVYATAGYLLGRFPPGQHNPLTTVRVLAALWRGHAAASLAIKRINPTLKVGIVHNFIVFQPATHQWRDTASALLYDYLFNQALFQALQTGRILPPFGTGIQSVPGLRDSIDFFGLNYYTRTMVAFDIREPLMLFGRRFTPADVPQSDCTATGESYGEIYPPGIYRALKRVAALGKPIYITETGLPDADDDQRPAFLLSHLAEVHRAITAGVDVRGFFHWTLVDNFEWADGWGLRFGLYHLNQQTGERTLRRSGALYAALARANALPDDKTGEM